MVLLASLCINEMSGKHHIRGQNALIGIFTDIPNTVIYDVSILNPPKCFS